MKRLTILPLLLFCLFEAVSAQKKGVTVGLDTHVSAYDKAFAPVELGAELGYGFTDRLNAGLRFEQAYAHVEADGVKTYEDNIACGLFVGYDMLRFDTSMLTFKVGGGASLKDDSWKYVYYDGGLYLQTQRGSSRIYGGIGARYYDSRGEFLGNKWRAYLSVGFSYAI